MPQQYTTNEKFAANIPYNLNSTGWSIVSGRAENTAVGLANNQVFQRRDTYVDGTVRVVATLSAGETLAVFRKPIPGSGGTIVTLETDTNLLAWRASWSGSTTLPAVYQSKTLAFALVPGRKYVIELIKVSRQLSAVVTDTVTGQSDSIAVYANSSNQGGGLMIGAPGFANIAGTSQVYSLAFSPRLKRPGVLLFGDSITEGSLATLDADSWAYKVCANANGGGMVSAKGGDTSASPVRRLGHECLTYRPRYVVVMIGTNDTDMTLWQRNVTQMEANIRACGATPIFCTLPPEAADTNPVLVQNPFIRASGWRYIDMARALTTNGDGSTRNASLFGDALHPNDAGHAAMYQRVRLDLPELFD